MFVTTLDFQEVLEKFYASERHDFMFLFVSSFDCEDKKIVKAISDNAKNIDKVTGKRICMYYFAERIGYMDDQTIHIKWVGDHDFRKMTVEAYEERTIDVSEEICGHWIQIRRSYLPAFMLISKDRSQLPRVFSVKSFDDFNCMLKPLNVIHSYLFDKERLVSCRTGGMKLSAEEVKKIEEADLTIKAHISLQERKMAREITLGMLHRAEKRNVQIRLYKERLSCNELLLLEHSEGLDSLSEELDKIRRCAVSNLSLALASDDGKSIIQLIDDGNYTDALLKVWDLVTTKSVRISNAIRSVRQNVLDNGYDVFISCKSEDYVYAHDLYDFLVEKGFKPFLADVSIKEAGYDVYTMLIGEVLEACNNMIAFATNVDYLKTTYVSSEWHAFVNDMNTGKKATGRLINVLSPDVNIHQLPTWLRDKQCLMLDTYKESLLNYLVK